MPRSAVSWTLLLALGASLGASGCWKDYAEYGVIPENALLFDPEIGGPPDWIVSPIPVKLECPDGEDARFYMVYPEAALTSGAPMPAVVLYHSGSYDFVYAPSPEDPLEGTHFATPSRLTSEWAVRQVFSTLGMYPNQLDGEVHDASLPVALADAGIAMLLPSNCWGDLWHNVRSLADNDFNQDRFFRDGRAAAEWGYRFLLDPVFASTFGMELPIAIDPDEVYAIGLGEGGRAVTELLQIDETGPDGEPDGIPDYSPKGALVDSSRDDLRIYFADPSLYGNTLAGLTRLYPGGESTVSGLYEAPLPERFGYLFSSNDDRLPERTHDAIVQRMQGMSTGWLYVETQGAHVLLNDERNGLAQDAVRYLTTGERPPPGPGNP